MKLNDIGITLSSGDYRRNAMAGLYYTLLSLYNNGYDVNDKYYSDTAKVFESFVVNNAKLMLERDIPYYIFTYSPGHKIGKNLKIYINGYVDDNFGVGFFINPIKLSKQDEKKHQEWVSRRDKNKDKRLKSLINANIKNETSKAAYNAMIAEEDSYYKNGYVMASRQNTFCKYNLFIKYQIYKFLQDNPELIKDKRIKKNWTKKPNLKNIMDKIVGKNMAQHYKNKIKIEEEVNRLGDYNVQEKYIDMYTTPIIDIFKSFLGSYNAYDWIHCGSKELYVIDDSCMLSKCFYKKEEITVDNINNIMMAKYVKPLEKYDEIIDPDKLKHIGTCFISTYKSPKTHRIIIDTFNKLPYGKEFMDEFGMNEYLELIKNLDN